MPLHSQVGAYIHVWQALDKICREDFEERSVIHGKIGVIAIYTYDFKGSFLHLEGRESHSSNPWASCWSFPYRSLPCCSSRGFFHFAHKWKIFLIQVKGSKIDDVIRCKDYKTPPCDLSSRIWLDFIQLCCSCSAVCQFFLLQYVFACLANKVESYRAQSCSHDRKQTFKMLMLL